MYIPPTTDLLKPGTIRDFCDAYAESVATVDAAILSLAQARARMTRIIERFNVIPQNFADFNLDDNAARVRAESAKLMQRSAWQALIGMTGVLDVMTQKKRDEFYKNIEAGNVPPVTYEAVMGMIAGLRGDIGQIVSDAIAEAARILRPTTERYKTNSAWALGKRAIVAYGVRYSYGSFSENYVRSGDIQAIDNAFHLLDGQGVPSHPRRLQDAISLAMSKHDQACKTQYFSCRWHKTGSLHFEFLRMDLVDALNARAADHRTLRSEVA